MEEDQSARQKEHSLYAAFNNLLERLVGPSLQNRAGGPQKHSLSSQLSEIRYFKFPSIGKE